KDLDRALAVNCLPNRSGLRAMKACLLIQQGDYAKALVEADAAAAEKDASTLALYNAACAYSLCVRAAGKDTKLSADERTKRAEDHARKALAALKRLAETGYFRDASKVEQFRKDSDFEPLRARPDFRAFAAEVEKAVGGRH